MAPAHSGERLHSLDALRAVALLLGLVLHSMRPAISTPGAWAVGRDDEVDVLVWLSYYLHAFRLPVFFLMAGYFGALVVTRRGLTAWAGDRLRRVLVVFAVALVPMKILLTLLWTWGGHRTGWLPPAQHSESVWSLTIDTLTRERLPHLPITHLWFLYYLWLISIGWTLAAALVTRSARIGAFAGRWAPLVLTLAVAPVISKMHTAVVDTPDASLLWHLPVLAVYTVYFAIGWVLCGAPGLLTRLGDRANGYFLVGLALSIAGAALGLAMLYPGAWELAHWRELRWALALTTSAVTACSTLGWVGLFVRYLARPNRSLHYLAEASYWIYVVHLPVMIAFQVWWADAGAPWFVTIPIVNVATFAVCLLSYQFLVRSTWVGAWLRGAWPRRRRVAVP